MGGEPCPTGVPVCLGRKFPRAMGISRAAVSMCGHASVYKNTQNKQKIGNTYFIYILKIQIQAPYKYVRSIVCRRWADPTWAMWSSGSRGLGKHPVNYLRKSSLPEHLRLSCCGRHHQSSLAFSMHVWWWWCRWRRRHPWPRRSMSQCDIAGTSAAPA